MGIVLLLKFGDPVNIKSLYERGEVYMNFLSSFKKRDENADRFDFLEGTITNKFVKEAIFEFKFDENSDWKKLRSYDNYLNWYHNINEFYCYSLYSITVEDLEVAPIFTIDHRMKRFGASFLMINNHVTFINKIKNHLDNNGYDYLIGRVKYYDRYSDQAKLTLLNKNSDYIHQHEFRILVRAKSDRPLKFEVGPLTSDSEMLDSTLVDTIRLRLIGTQHGIGKTGRHAL